MSESSKMYEFGEFRVDVENGTLFRGADALPLTPKVFETLVVLVENAGKLVEKATLMDRIWHDRFVEESNLTYNIKVLRKTLGDSAQSPTFIENIPRKGYRFVAKVGSPEEIRSNGHANPALNGSIGNEVSVKVARSSTNPRRLTYAIGAVIVLFSAAVASFYFGTRRSSPGIPVLSSESRMESLSITGQVQHARISPDGKKVAYVARLNEGEGLWMRDLTTLTNIEMIPSSGGSYFGLTFSNSGDYLYFVRNDGHAKHPSTYRIPVGGGIPEVVVERTQGWISLSPDDRKIAFVRSHESYENPEIPYSLMVADIGGGPEKTLASVTRPNRIAANAWSPNGKTIAFAVGQSEKGGEEFKIAEIDVETGNQRDLTDQHWFAVGGMIWFADSSGLLITANSEVSQPAHIWMVNRSENSARPLTRDSTNYVGLSMNSDGSLIVATTVVGDFRLETTALQPEYRPSVLSPAFESVAYAPDGRIVFSTNSNWQEDLWIMDKDGADPIQLTNDVHNDTRPLVSPDGIYIFFASNRSGSYQVWRMNLDGSEPRRITKNEGGYPIYVSKDGNEIYFMSSAQKNLWKIAPDDGTEELILEKAAHSRSVSPDGRFMANFKHAEPPGIEITSLDNSVPERLLPLADKTMRPLRVKFSADGSSLIYAVRFQKNINIWEQPLDGRQPKLLSDLGDSGIMDFSISPDQKTVAAVRGKWKHDAVLISGLK
jgi:Tol biopolymer transport system component/DNA-binding winged helix-turn-helix (wHTH) protein